MKYNNSGRTYQVDSIEYDGEVINVFGSSITDIGVGYTVFIEGDEVYFETFEEAYNFAKDHASEAATETSADREPKSKEASESAFNDAVARAEPIIVNAFNKLNSVSDTTIEGADCKTSTICINCMVECECIGTDYNDDAANSEDLDESDIRSASYFEDVDIINTGLTEEDVDALIKEVNTELEKEALPIRLVELTTEFDYEYHNIVIDDIKNYRVEKGDTGIGGYEYWGETGYDSRPYAYLTDVEFTGTVPTSFCIKVALLNE